ncbi:MAG: hypothetical protein LKK13_04655 [Bacilli bacterium]|jgi:uncharacterized membrane protein|nr:hypothetical protein [Bacilli bacterium]
MEEKKKEPKEEKGVSTKKEKPAGKKSVCLFKRRGLVLASAITAIGAGLALLMFAILCFSATDSLNSPIGIMVGLVSLFGAGALITFGVFNLIHLYNGKFNPRALFPVSALVTGGVSSFVGIASICLANSAFFIAYGILLILLSVSVLALGTTSLLHPRCLQGRERIFEVLSCSLSLAVIALRLGAIIAVLALDLVVFVNDLVFLLASAATFVLGLVLIVGPDRPSIKKEQRKAETLLAYEELFEKGVIDEKDFKAKADEIRR